MDIEEVKIREARIREEVKIRKEMSAKKFADEYLSGLADVIKSVI